MKKLLITTLSLFYGVCLNAAESQEPSAVIFKNTKDVTLSGSHYTNKKTDSIIIMTHGAANGRTANGLFSDIIPTLHEQGYDILAYDMSGHGESQDAIFSLEYAVSDVKAAIDWCKNQGYKTIILLGHSLGGYASLAGYDPSIKTILLLGSVCGPVDIPWTVFSTPEQLQAMEKTGYMTIGSWGTERPFVRYNKMYCDQVKSINQEELIKPIKCPTLLINGTIAHEQLFQDLAKKAVSLLPERSKHIILPATSHDFNESRQAMIQELINWLVQYAPLADQP